MKKSLLTFTFCLLTFSSLLAQWHTPSDSSLWPTSPDSGLIIAYGHSPQIVSDQDGGAIVAFQSQDIVKAKRVDKYGWLQWNGWSGVNVGGIGDAKTFYSITEDEDGGAFAAIGDWICYTDCGTPNEEGSNFVSLQSVDHWGNKLWGDGVRVTTLDTVIQWEAKVMSDNKGGCIVSWLDDRHVVDPWTEYYDIYIQRLDSLGNRCWGDSAIRISSSPTIFVAPIMIVNENGETYLVWWDGSNFIMQRLDIYGNKLWTPNGLQANQIPGPIGISDLVEGFILAGLLSTNGRYRLACQHIDSSGQRLWGNLGVTLADSVLINESDATGMLHDDSGNIIISYFFARSGEQPNTYLQKLTFSGTKIFPEEGLLASNSILSERGGGMILYENTFLYPWNDSRGGTYVQKFDFNGNRLWNEDVYFSTRGIVQGQFTNDSYGGIIKVDQYLDFSIKLIKISKNGIIGEVIPTSIHDNNINSYPKGLVLYQNHPNPLNGTTTIKFWLAKPSHVKLKIYDVNGRLLQKRNLGLKVSSEQEISIDMNAYASGLYFYQLTAGNHSQVKKFLLIK